MKYVINLIGEGGSPLGPAQARFSNHPALKKDLRYPGAEGTVHMVDSV